MCSSRRLMRQPLLLIDGGYRLDKPLYLFNMCVGFRCSDYQTNDYQTILGGARRKYSFQVPTFALHFSLSPI
jgi:hypothetical protein